MPHSDFTFIFNEVRSFLHFSNCGIKSLFRGIMTLNPHGIAATGKVMKTSWKAEKQCGIRDNPMDNKAFTEHSSVAFEVALKDVNEELLVLISNYSDILSEKVAMDISLVHELNEVLKEAKTLENQLKQKKESLRKCIDIIFQNTE